MSSHRQIGAPQKDENGKEMYGHAKSAAQRERTDEQREAIRAAKEAREHDPLEDPGLYLYQFHFICLIFVCLCRV